MKSRRQEKLESLYHSKVSFFVEKNIKIENALITIMGVNLSDDLKRLKIYFSVWPDEKTADVIKSLEEIKRELREHLAGEIKSKFVPALEFAPDESEKKRIQIEGILKNIS